MSEHKAREAIAQPSHDTCIDCRFMVASGEQFSRSVGECWYEPPGVGFVAGPKGVLKLTANPEVQLTKTWCSKFERQAIRLATSAQIAAVEKGK